MLVLTRRSGESIRIGNDVTVTVVQLSRGRVRIGIEAPAHVAIVRTEILASRMSQVDGQHRAAVDLSTSLLS